MRPFKMRISKAAAELYRGLLRDASELGDCAVAYDSTGAVVAFDDYEGAAAVLRSMRADQPTTAGGWATKTVVIRNLLEGISAAASHEGLHNLAVKLAGCGDA
jgi:hypothetical protein